MRTKRMFALIPAIVVAVAVAAAPQSSAGQKWYEKAVKKVDASFSPAEAKPGQTVTFSVTVELNEGYHTYPMVQADKGAASMVNKITFPAADAVVFVGDVIDPPGGKSKAEPAIGILDMRYHEGKVTYSRKAVISPRAKAGEATIKLAAFKLSVCDENNCFPPKDVPVMATLKVLDGPAVEVEKAFAEEVAKALAK